MSISDSFGPSRHPQEHELADFLDGEGDPDTSAAIAVHIAACSRCRFQLDVAADPDSEPAIPADGPRAGSRLPRIPEGARVALQDAVVRDPAAGQFWSLRVTDAEGEELRELVVVVDIAEDVLVAPLSADPPEATDSWALQVRDEHSSMRFAAWVSLGAPVGWEALDICVGAVDPLALLEVHRAFRRRDTPPRGMSLGRPVDETLSAYRDQLKARLADIAACRIFAFSEEDPPDDEGVPDLVTQMQEAGWKIRDLSRVASISAKDARLVLERGISFSAEQADRVRAELGVDGRNAVAPPDPSWVAEVARPVYRRRFERIAHRRDVDPWTLRSQQAAQPQILAARGNRGSRDDWATLVEQHLARLEAAAGIEA